MEKLDAKTITSAGGILLAAFAMWGYMKLADNRVSELVGSINSNSTAIAELAKATQSNTEVIRQLLTSRLDTVSRNGK